MPPTQVVIAPPCPVCTGHGLARVVTIKDRQRTVTYECEDCRNRWNVTDTVSSPSSVNRPQP